MKPRHIEPRLIEALSDRPVVALVGPRQTGKSTLALRLVDLGILSTYRTMDDLATLGAARDDPIGFLQGSGHGIVIDEVQRAPELYLAIKREVDRDRRSGSYLLTGSADVMALPTLADTLVGRAEVLTLLPLSAGELAGRPEDFVAWALRGSPPVPVSAPTDEAVVDRIVRGGFPEPSEAGDRFRDRWFGAYVTTILQREIRELSGIAGVADLPRLLAMLAARTATLLNVAELSRASGLPQSTLRRYLALLEATYLTTTLSAWTGDPGRRLARAPKIHLTDTGLAAWLAGSDRTRLRADRGRLGALLETYVATELRRQIGWSAIDARLSHYRSHDGVEVDLVLEDRGGRMAGIEVKASASVRPGDVRGLRRLAERAGERWVRGVILYLGRDVVPFGERLHALPITALWETPAAT